MFFAKKKFGELDIMFTFAKIYISLKQPKYESVRLLFITRIESSKTV